MADAGGTLTVFGATLLELMARRGVRTWSRLSAMLRQAGYNFTPQRISNWAYGLHAADRRIGRALREVLELDEDEEIKLALAFLNGQDEKIDADYRETA